MCTPQETDIVWPYLNIIKAIYNKPTANIFFSSVVKNSISSKIRNKIRVCLLLLPLFDIALEALATAIQIEKEIKGIQTDGGGGADAGGWSWMGKQKKIFI